MPNLSLVSGKGSAVQHEIRQSKPFASKGQEGVVGLLRTADLLRRSLLKVVAPHGLTLQQYNVLRILRGAGDAGLPTLEIAGRMIEQAPGITRLLDRLEAKKLVRRKRCPSDRRQVLARINPPGLELLERLEEPIRVADSALLGRLPRRRLEMLIELLDDVRTAAMA
jgi:DNA-binding MarR family transcriptional regulator